MDQEQIIRTAFGDRNPIAEVDLPFDNTAGGVAVYTELVSLDIKPELVSIQFQQSGASSATEIGKYSLHEGYDIDAGAGNIVTHLAQLVVSQPELDSLKVKGFAGSSNMHIVCY